MRWIEKVKKYYLSARYCRTDFLLLLLLAGLFLFCHEFRMTAREAFRSRTEITLGYNAKQGPDGRFYVLDKGHERLIGFDESGTVSVCIENPSDDTGGLWYVDDFFVGEDGIYLSASEWDGMALAREAILRYGADGRYRQTLTERDYSENRTNKHRFYGLEVQNGAVRYVECLDDTAVIAGREVPYPNAFNAVSDAVFFGDTAYLLDKDGTVRAFREDGGEAEVVYCLAEEPDSKVIPYRLTADRAGNLYFTDIRNRAVRKIDPASKTSSVCCAPTDSLTVGVTADGQFLLLDEQGLHLTGNGETTDYLLLQKNRETILKQTAWLTAQALMGLIGLSFLTRLVLFLFRRKYGIPQMVSFWVIGAVAGVAVLICGMMVQSFRTSYREKLEEQVISAACMVANQISGDDIRTVETTGGFGGPAYRRLCTVMEKSFPMEIAFYRQLYCNILTLSEDREDGYAVAYLDQSIGSYFPLDRVERQELQTVYETGKPVWNKAVEDISGEYLSVKVPVRDEAGTICGAVAVGTETYVITDILGGMLRKIFTPVVVLLMLVWLVTLEITSFVRNYGIYRKNIELGEQNVLPGYLVRLLVFLVFAAYNMTATFLPVYLLRRTDIFPAELRELAGALPITVNIFLIGVMSLFCAGLVKRYGARNILSVSAACSLAGNLLIFVRQDFLSVCIGLVLDGIGVGLITNAVYVMLTYIQDEVNRTWGLTIYNSAYLSGINFGMILGSLLAVWLGQHAVFAVVALSWLMMIFLTRYLVRQMEGILGPPAAEPEPRQSPEQGIATRRFVLSRPVLSFLALVQNPYIIFGSFVFYYVPLFCDAQGYSETICSMLIMLYSQVAAMGSDGLTGWVSGKIGDYGIYTALGMNVAALLVFAAFRDMTGMVAALVIMGVGAAYGKPVQQNYYLGMEKVKQYGEDKAMGLYNFTENIGESLGPVVFGRMMLSAHPAVSMRVFCIAVSGMKVLHYLLVRKEFGDEKGKM